MSLINYTRDMISDLTDSARQRSDLLHNYKGTSWLYFGQVRIAFVYSCHFDTVLRLHHMLCCVTSVTESMISLTI